MKMAFNFGTPKSASGFTLPTSTVPATATTQLNFAGASGDPVQSKSLFGSTATITPSFGFGSNAAASTAGTLNFSAPATTTTATSASFSMPTTSTSTGGFSSTTTSFNLSTTTAPSTTALGFALLGTNASLASSLAIVAGTPITTSTLAASSTTSILPTSGALTYSQLEDAINKWTLDLEEQGKVFSNQAKHLNAWDRLLIGNGEKILNVSGGIERVKQQQQKLDQDLDFVLAQQKELEDCIIPLEKELQDVTIADTERDQTYKLAETIDSQLKQMSEDLKEIIEHLNESNKAQELSDPVAQIGRILSAHMNSLQWIDRSTSQISSQLDDISKMNDVNKKKVDSLMSQKYNMS